MAIKKKSQRLTKGFKKFTITGPWLAPIVAFYDETGLVRDGIEYQIVDGNLVVEFGVALTAAWIVTIIE